MILIPYLRYRALAMQCISHTGEVWMYWYEGNCMRQTCPNCQTKINNVSPCISHAGKIWKKRSPPWLRLSIPFSGISHTGKVWMYWCDENWKRQTCPRCQIKINNVSTCISHAGKIWRKKKPAWLRLSIPFSGISHTGKVFKCFFTIYLFAC